MSDDREREARLRGELRRRGMSEAEVDRALRKKKRRAPLEFEVMKSRHIMREARPQRGTSAQLCTVDYAADLLEVHPKTVLRFIREGRLKATRIGKAYRILRSDLAEFSGAPAVAPEPAPEEASVTSIVDVPDVDAALAKSWAKVVTASLKRPTGLSVQVMHEPERSHLKIVIAGPPGETVAMLGQIRVWLAQLRR